MFWNRRLGRLEFRLERNWSDMFFFCVRGEGGGRLLLLLRNFKASIKPRTRPDGLQEAGSHGDVRSVGPRSTSFRPITIG